MATSSSVILLIVAGSFLGAAYGGDKLHVPPAQDISSFTFQLRSIYGNTTLSNKTFDNNDMIGDDGGPRLRPQLNNRRPPRLGQQLPDADDNLNIYALPVGQGDCTVIQCPIADGGKITIIDAGSSRVTGFTRAHLVNFLRLDQVTIQSIFLTHPDLDHINYINAILDAYRRQVRRQVDVYHSCEWRKYTRRIRGRINPRYADPTRVPYCCGETCNHEVPLCEVSGVTLKVIGSENNNNNCANRNKNGDSIVSIIEYRGVKTLIAGDFEGDEAFVRNFIECPGNDLSADILRLPHHGAYNEESTELFLDAINARYVFSSSGFRYGHPRCELYDYYITRRVAAPEEQQLAAAEEHYYYTCQRRIGRRNYQRVTHEPARAIYVTTVNDGIRLHNINYVIWFRINNEGEIESSAQRVHV